MAQGPGMLNTAPPPIPGGGTNPAGANVGIPNVGMPNLNPTQVLTPQAVQQGSNANLFPANTGGTSPTNIGNVNLGFKLTDPKAYGNLYREMTRAYGQGIGSMLFQMLTGGMWNSQIAQGLINAMQPARVRGLNDVLGSFGAEGARFSSAAAIGTGDFESQFALNEQQVLSNLALQDQEMQMQLLMGILPTLHGEQANQGGLFGKILGGLEVGAGAALAPFTGGASLAMVGPGLSSLEGNKGGGTPGGGQPNFAQILSQMFNKGSVSPVSIPTTQQSNQAITPDDLTNMLLMESAGQLYDPSQGSNQIPIALQ